MQMKFLEREIVSKYYKSRQTEPKVFPKISTDLHYHFLDVCCTHYGFGYRIICENVFGLVSCFQTFDSFGRLLLYVCTPFGYYVIDLEEY